MKPTHRAGLTLIELIFGLAILAVLLVAMQQAIAVSTQGAADMGRRQDLAMEARRAMERMVLAVSTTTWVTNPVSTTATSQLCVQDRLLDQYDNRTGDYAPDGDGFLDADNDRDGIITTIDTLYDPVDFLDYELDKHEDGNVRLLETRSDYSTVNSSAALRDTASGVPLCEHVALFACRMLTNSVVEIRLTLEDGASRVSLRTCVLPRALQ